MEASQPQKPLDGQTSYPDGGRIVSLTSPLFAETINMVAIPCTAENEMEANVPFLSQGYLPQVSSLTPLETPLERMEQSSIQRFFPQVSETQKPREGQEFETWEDAFEFYNTYAKQAGFSVRKDGGKKKKGTDIWTWKNFVCSKEGETNLCHQRKRKNPENKNLRRRGRTRCDCKAKMNIIRNKHNAFYRVSIFTEDHNHPLSTPGKVHFLRSHRRVSNVAKDLVDDFEAANVPTSQQLRLMAKQAGGIKNMGCTEKDIRNYKRTKKEKRKGHDARCLKEYFLAEKAKNPLFYFKIMKDEHNNMTRCFWVDSVAREAYTLFGDVVVFDTTYNTNEYCMIFAPLTGVNHHGQTIVLAYAFLSGESKESFAWLFKQWLKVFSAPPKVIITDQCPSMMEVIPEVLPTTIHRLCIWHIMSKFSDKLGPLAAKLYYEYFKDSVYNSETVEDFEISWRNALEKSGLEDNHWLKIMYKIRERWVPAYLRDNFHAGMSSSQRAESNHSFFKKYIDKKNSLMLFITRFNMAIEHQRNEESRADHIDIYECPKLLTRMPMEEQMRDVYTRKYFQLFQEQVVESEVYFAKLLRNEEFHMEYEVHRIDIQPSKVRNLVYDKCVKIAKCSCKKFEFDGIPCRHIIAFLKINGEFCLPDEYILRRWTKSARVGIGRGKDGFDLKTGGEFLMMRKTMLSHIWSSTMDLALQSAEGTEYLKKILESSMIYIKDINAKINVEKEPMVNTECLEIINEPLAVKAKGSGKRLKPSKEKAMVKSRLCRSCNHRGVAHDSRNCPLLADRT